MKAVRYPEGCAMTLYLPLVLLTNNGKSAVNTSKFTDLKAFISLHGTKTEIVPVLVDSYLTLFLPETLTAGQYTFGYSFKYDSIPNKGQYSGMLEIVKDNGQSNWGSYVSNGIAHLDDQVFIAGNMMTDAELERLKAQYIAATNQANTAKAAADTAKAQADAVAYNAANNLTPTAIAGAVSTGVANLPTLTQLQAALATLNTSLKGTNTAATLTALKAVCDAIPTATYTEQLAAIKQVVDALPTSTLDDDDKQDILNAIASATPTINLQPVLDAISASQTAVINAMPSTSGLATETTAEAARVAAVAAKTAAENITIPADVARKTDLPTDYAKKTDIPTDYAKESTFTTWATGLWASFKSAVESFISRTNAALGEDTPASGESAKSVHGKLDALAAENAEFRAKTGGGEWTAQEIGTSASNAASSAAQVLSRMDTTPLAAFPNGAYLQLQTLSGQVDVTISSNVLYVLGNVSSLTLHLAAPTRTDIANEYQVICSPSTDFTIVIKDSAGNDVNFATSAAAVSGKTCEISVQNNIAYIANV